ncbi:MAG: hypothetical protein AAB964_01760 [Patescibacteria group bacterium]
MTHHAYVYEGSLQEFGALKEHLHPFVAQTHDRFSIDDARELIARCALKTIGEATFLIALSSITTEAQQALLKLLEEPQRGITFVFLVPHGALLPTVRSRMAPFVWQRPATGPLGSSPRDRQQVSAFLKASPHTRSDMVAALLKDEEGAKERVRDFVYALEAELAKKIKDPAARAALHDIARVRDYLRDRSPSLKMLLEHLAMSVPTV